MEARIANGRVDDKEARHEAKVMDVIRSRFREARRSKLTGKMVVEIQMFKGGSTNLHTEVGVIFKILEEA